MRIVAIGGEPATGKTTLLRAFLKLLSSGSFCELGQVKYHLWESEYLVVLGDYRQSGFAGTDRLSMSVQPQDFEFVRSLSADPLTKWAVVFEGDRLFNTSFLSECKEISDLVCWILDTEQGEKERRCLERGSKQNEIWMKGRVSKIRRIASQFEVNTKRHDTKEDTRRLAKRLLRLVKT